MRSQRAHPRHKNTHASYNDEKHSLQGQYGKTHGVC